LSPPGIGEVVHGDTAHSVSPLHSALAPPTDRSPHSGTAHPVQGQRLTPILAPLPTLPAVRIDRRTTHVAAQPDAARQAPTSHPTRRVKRRRRQNRLAFAHGQGCPPCVERRSTRAASSAVGHLCSPWRPPTRESPHNGTPHGVREQHLVLTRTPVQVLRLTPVLVPLPTCRVKIFFHGGTSHTVIHPHSARVTPTKESPHSGTSHTVEGPHLAPTLAPTPTGGVEGFHGGTSHTINHLHPVSLRSDTEDSVRRQRLTSTLTLSPPGRDEVVHGGTSHTVGHPDSPWRPPTRGSPHSGTPHVVREQHLILTPAPAPTDRVKVVHDGTSHAVDRCHPD